LHTAKSSYRRVAAYVALHARRRPGHVAVLADGRPVTYAKLHQDLQAMTQALRGFGLAQGSLVAVGHEDLYIQLLIVFGLESLGIASGSFRPAEGRECNALVTAADLTMVQHKARERPYGRLFEITDDWVATTLAAPILAPARITPAAPDEVAVVFRSSGTTGLPKRMRVTHAMLHPRLVSQRIAGMGHGLTSRARYLAIMHLSAGAMYLAASNCLRLGATFMFNMASGALPALVSFQPTNLTALPYQLREMLVRLPWNPALTAPVLPGLTIVSAGATLPEDLRRYALQRLCGRILEVYGSNEAGTNTVIDETGEGRFAVGIEAEIVDEDCNPVPIGVTGQLRLRGPGIVKEYVDDPATTAEKFRGGWFYPGDIAVLAAPGRMKLAGRPSDVLNLGGKKIASAVLESKILASAEVLDVALVQPDSAVASPPVIACVVVKGAADLRALAKIIGPIIGFPCTLRVVAEIPRTAEGKIKRNALLQSLSHLTISAAADVPATLPDQLVRSI
jgi:acyl-coenzyme A synthetase/AMP-(fatty) acid ligase